MEVGSNVIEHVSGKDRLIKRVVKERVVKKAPTVRAFWQNLHCD